MDKYIKGEIMELLWLSVYIVFIIGVLSLFFGLGAGGFERNEVLAKNNFYIPYGVIFLFGLIACKVIGLFMFKESDKEIEGAIIHDPEQSVLGKMKLFRNTWLLSYFCVIIFGVLGYFASRYNTFFSAVPNYEQQFTPAADLFFSVYPASPTETLGALFLISIVGLVLGYFVLKNKLGFWSFNFIFIPTGAIVSMIYGIINHLARYSESGVAMSSVALFWFVGGGITTVTGSVIPFLIMHDANNFFFRFSKLFSSEVVTFTTFAVIVIMIFLFLLVFFKVKYPKPKNKL